MATVRMTVAQALVRFLANQYLEVDGQEQRFVKGVFGIFGHGNLMGIGDALVRQKDLPFIQGHNEQGMVHAAIAYAKQRNRKEIWACTTSIGPGAMNLVTGAATATVNRIPVLLLPGDIFATRHPDPVLQQLEDPTSWSTSANDALRPVSRYWDRILRPEQLISACLRAMEVLTDPAETGAVTLALPQDVQCEAYDFPEEFLRRRVHRIRRLAPDERDIREAASVLSAARRPLLVLGGGVHYSEAYAEVDQFVQGFGVPFVETQAGKGAFTYDHPFNMGSMGVTGTLPGNRLAAEADLFIGVGTRWSDFTTASKTALARGSRVVNINASARDAAKLEAVAVVGDATLALRSLTAILRETGWRAAYDAETLASTKLAWEEELRRLAGRQAGERLPQTAVIAELNRLLGDDAVIVNAAGSLPGDLHRMWRCKARKTYHMEYGFSCMGYEVAGALGVKLAEPAKEVYALVGDGSYLLLHSELYTALQLGVKIVVIVFNNYGFRSIHNLQLSYGGPGIGNEFRTYERSTFLPTGAYMDVNFAAYAEALGAVGIAVKRLDDLSDALARAAKERRSVVIDVPIAPGTETSAYEAWWHVAVPAVSEDPAILEAAQRNRAMLEKALPY